MNSLPRISVVTPSYNQGAYLEQTINSILSQNYPALEYIIIDGRSTDCTLAVLEKYSSRLDYVVSEPDLGQSHAINKGLARATGEILTWLNADDYYLPGALWKIARYWHETGGFHCVFGHSYQVDEGGRVLPEPLRARLIDGSSFLPCSSSCITPQPSSLFSADCYRKVGPLNETLHYAMDVDFWMKISAARLRFAILDDFLACLRRHARAKSSAGNLPFIMETVDVLLRRTALSDRNRAYWRLAKRSCLHAYYWHLAHNAGARSMLAATAHLFRRAPAAALRHSLPAFLHLLLIRSRTWS